MGDSTNHKSSFDFYNFCFYNMNIKVQFSQIFATVEMENSDMRFCREYTIFLPDAFFLNNV